MTRGLGTFGLAILFLTISPALRDSVLDNADAVQQWVLMNSPLSYVGIGVLVLAGMMFALNRASQPRV